MQTYLGTTHAHTGAFNNHGEDSSTPADVFQAADEQGFDFFILTEHSGPTGPADPVRFYDDARLAATEHTSPVFAALVGYEYSENPNDDDSDHGHLTAVGTTDFVSAAAPRMDFAAFFAYLAEQDEDHMVLAGFNHPVASGHRASRTALLSAPSRRLVALSETYNHTTYVRAREERYYAALIAELDRGWRVAPTCGLDSHGFSEVRAVEDAEYSPCRTGILAQGLTPDRVMSAIRARRTFATRDPNLTLRYSANGAWMGSRLGTPGRVRFEIRVKDPNSGRPADRIRRVQVVGSGGRVLAARRFDAHRVLWRPRVSSGRNRYMLVRAFTHDHPSATAIAAPVWLD